jgi:hypothetical protein
MKKLFLTAILIATVTTTFAQINFGLRGGINLADYTNLEDSSLKADYYIGALLSIKTGSLYTLQPEFTYSKQGTKLNGTYADLQSNTISVNYFSLTVANKFSIANNAHFIIGPYFDIVMDRDIQYTRPIQDDYYYYDRYDTVGVDLGFFFGFGFDVTKNITLEARYKQGFIGIIDGVDRGSSSEYYYDEDPHLNKVIQLGISYKFDLLKSEKK